MSKVDEIPAISFIAEPLLVASLLTIGCLANRRKTSQLATVQNAGPLSPSRPGHMYCFRKQMRVPDTAPFEGRIFSRFLARFPFVLEVWYWLLTYWVYQIARAMQALAMGDGTRDLSQRHGILLVELERWLHIDIELALQHLVLVRPTVLWFFNKTYAMVHIPATVTFFAYSYYSFHPAVFQRIRRTLVLCNCLAFVIFTLWPCMPPRLLPFEEFGFIDTLHTGKAASIWTTNKFQNQLAAFPSLHFGYSFVIGLSLHLHSPHKLVKMIAPFYPVLILLVIMATANHYLLDAVGGGIVSLLAYRWNTILLNLRPLEEWGFWAARTTKPMEQEMFNRIILMNEGSAAEEGYIPKSAMQQV